VLDGISFYQYLFFRATLAQLHAFFSF